MVDNITIPFIDYVKEDKSHYPLASSIINPGTNKPYQDPDSDFLVGESKGFLMNMNFKFINTSVFSEVARIYERNIKDPDLVKWIDSLEVPVTENRNKHYYCPYRKGTAEYDAFWSRETNRRRAGMTVPCKLLSTGEIVDLRITGDQYTYLNYGRLMRTPNTEEREELHRKGDFKTELVPGFPRFWDGDYWNFKIDEFIGRNKYHLCKAKARGKGFSFKRGSQAANTINLIPSVTVVLAAYLIDYLIDPDATQSMAKRCLDWFENNTHWKRNYLSEDPEATELGYKLTKSGSKKYGWLSRLIAVSTRGNSSAAIGKRALEIDFEEAGKLANLLEALDVTMSSTEVGAGNVGTIRCYGTAGVEDADWEPFSYLFYNPDAYGMFPMENIWDSNSRHNRCGFFFPQVWDYEPYIDIHGNSLIEEAYEFDLKDKERKKLSMTPDKHASYVGQRANSPEEAFRRGKDNLFTSPELTMHLQEVKHNFTHKYYRDGQWVETTNGLIFKPNIELETSGIATHPFIDSVPFIPGTDLHGCVREFHPPFKINDKIPDDLYVLLYDTVAKDKKSDTIISANSLNAMYVVMLPNTIANSRGDIIVASYIGRPELMVSADRIAYNLCRSYNAKALVEMNVGETLSNFKKWQALQWLLKDPSYFLAGKPDSSNIPYGIIIGDDSKADTYLTSLRELIYSEVSMNDEGKKLLFLHYIKEVGLLTEFDKFSRIGNFDRISSFRLYPTIRNYYILKRRTATNTSTKSTLAAINLYGFNN